MSIFDLSETITVLACGALVWALLMLGVQSGNALSDYVNQRRSR